MEVPAGRAASSTRRILPPAISMRVPAEGLFGLRFARSLSSTRDTEAMEGRASPRKPRVAMESRSSAVRSLEVAWRSKASRASSRFMPWPLSVMRMSLRPPASTSTRMRVAPASRAFSSSSLTTEAGRSTTSPAAIWLATWSGRMRMRPIAFQNTRLPGDCPLKEAVSEGDEQEDGGVEGSWDQLHAGFGNVRGEEGDQRDSEEKAEVGPDYEGIRVLGVAQQVVMVDPDDGHEEIAEGVAGECRPEGSKGREGGLMRRIQRQHHDGDDDGDDAIGERAETFRGRLSGYHSASCHAAQARISSPQVPMTDYGLVAKTRGDGPGDSSLRALVNPASESQPAISSKE
jgi:hypothetical protein